ncbi:SDR family oxidoreductase [Roseibium denhamense]|uniref:NAD(P)-dependent dehydrogenase, short-chain alcohol dehydrogenase family n=1 Tax=Roseibium denhamense TaxID=76305 RepID=A0ABY1NBN2_9HYPH|nr:SDR family oxidoreductase [Roseibium denhamense]MTI06620.1 SDR family oxidoreductase [Roseibium denhamense]SMP05765.1 NAD(P)-dependent dehydrogenase, short-chain alcohol dehydrogenase family [Roseibium denhamense]
MIDLPSTPSFSLSGKRVLVAGASSGIGLACAAALAEAGGDVVLAARRTDKLQDAVAAMTAKGWSASALQLDIADVLEVEVSVARHGPFDVLVNSAGLARHTPSLETTPEDFDAVMNVNLRGAYFITQCVAKGLIAAGKPGSLINMSSQMAHVGGIDRAVYCASKFAVEGFTKAMALEFGPKKIRVNTICPTFIRTPLTEPTFDNPERVKWIEEKIKLGRTGTVEDIMGAVLYLASDASSLVTGTSLLVDGGWTAD